uniref:Major facilitator superfamily domain-containing protein 12 n=1 Tax=Syphacia muris TaxID=451379 RepID=A0A0N5AFJ7_9BILA
MSVFKTETSGKISLEAVEKGESSGTADTSTAETPSDSNSDVSATVELRHFQMFGYGFGHFYNDLCASMWFTYLMIFLENVLGFRSSISGLLMLIGQIVDAVCNPLVGIASDSSLLPAWFERRVGKRTSWHVIGTICVTISFPFVFNQCPVFNKDNSEWWCFGWFVLFIAIFQFGWSAVQTPSTATDSVSSLHQFQIAHLALIPELTQSPCRRATLSSLRYASTVLANLAVYGILAIFLNNDNGQSTVTSKDLKHFSNAAYIVIVVGVVATGIFYVLTKEPKGYEKKLSNEGASTSADTSHISSIKPMTFLNWLSEPQFYQISALYTLSRLYMNVSQVYLPFYVTFGQNFSKAFVAIIPMVCYAASFFFTIPTSIQRFNRYINKKVIFIVGCIFGIANCIWMRFPLNEASLFIVAIIFGGVQAVLLVGSLAFSSDMINKNTESAAFVFGAMSFLDKLANGVAYQIIELFNPECKDGENNHACTEFYRSIMAYIPGGCLMLALLVLLTLLTKKIGVR